MNQLRAAMEVLVEDRAVPPTPIDEIRLRAGRLERRRRATWRLGAAGCLAIAVAGGAVAVAGDATPPTNVVTAEPVETASAVPPQPPNSVPEVLAPTFVPPEGYLASGPMVDPIEGQASVTFSFTRPSQLVEGGVDGTLSVTLLAFEGASAGDLTDRASELTGQDDFTLVTLGGQTVAMRKELSGVEPPPGFEARVQYTYVVSVGDHVLAQVNAANVPEPVVGDVLASIDPPAAESQLVR